MELAEKEVYVIVGLVGVVARLMYLVRKSGMNNINKSCSRFLTASAQTMLGATRRE
jgi:hypothetical protein